MFKIAIIVPPFLGHIHPTLSIGKELLLKGHKVCWISPYENIGSLIPKGGEFIKLNALSPLVDIDFGMQSLQHLYEQILVPLNAAIYEETKWLLQKEHYDLIITDHQAFAGAMVAYACNIPFVTSVTAPAAIERSERFPEVMNFEHEQIVSLQQRLGINIDYPLVCSSPLTIVYTTTTFLQRDDFPSSYQFVGPSIRDRVEQPVVIEALQDSRPKILVTLGSLLKFDSSFVDKVVEAFQQKDLAIILVADSSLREKWPDNFFVYAHIPQLKVIEKVQAVICHAGYNTVCEALSFGVPLVTLPIVNDQSHVATKVINARAGIRLKYKRLTSEHLSQSLKELLSEGMYAQGAKNMKDSFAKAGGSQRAANLILEFADQQRNSRNDLH